MARRTKNKAYKNEYVHAYFGIHMQTLQVQCIWESRDGQLHGPFSHYVMSGRRAESEIILVYGVGDLECVSAAMVQDHGPRIRQELEAKAQKMREDRAAQTAATPALPEID